MPFRTITLDDGSVCTRNITNVHSDGAEFLPEKFAVPADTLEGERIYKALERLVNAVSEGGLKDL